MAFLVCKVAAGNAFCDTFQLGRITTHLPQHAAEHPGHEYQDHGKDQQAAPGGTLQQVQFGGGPRVTVAHRRTGIGNEGVDRIGQRGSCLVKCSHHRIATGRPLCDIGLGHTLARRIVVGERRSHRLQPVSASRVNLLQLGQQGLETFSIGCGLVEPVVKTVETARGTDIGQPLLYLDHAQFQLLGQIHHHDIVKQQLVEPHLDPPLAAQYHAEDHQAEDEHRDPYGDQQLA